MHVYCLWLASRVGLKHGCCAWLLVRTRKSFNSSKTKRKQIPGTLSALGSCQYPCGSQRRPPSRSWSRASPSLRSLRLVGSSYRRTTSCQRFISARAITLASSTATAHIAGSVAAGARSGGASASVCRKAVSDRLHVSQPSLVWATSCSCSIERPGATRFVSSRTDVPVLTTILTKLSVLQI